MNTIVYLHFVGERKGGLARTKICVDMLKTLLFPFLLFMLMYDRCLISIIINFHHYVTDGDLKELAREEISSDNKYTSYSFLDFVSDMNSVNFDSSNIRTSRGETTLEGNEHRYTLDCFLFSSGFHFPEPPHTSASLITNPKLYTTRTIVCVMVLPFSRPPSAASCRPPSRHMQRHIIFSP